MLPISPFIALVLALSMTVPAAGHSPGGAHANLQVIHSYQDPSMPGYSWQRARQPNWQAPRHAGRQAYLRQRLEQERRWRAYQHQRRLEAQRRWQAQQQRLHRQRQAHGIQAAPAPRRPVSQQRQSQTHQAGPDRRDGGPRPEIAPVAPEVVAFANTEEPGTIIIDTEARTLYFTLSESDAYAYPVAVGREGFGWYGTETVSRIASWPDWYPPESMRKREPHLPRMMTGGITNPLGARAIYLGDTLYRIHGTNDESSIGEAVSAGCFRLRNEHVVHLAELVEIGAKVRVVERWPTGHIAHAGGQSG